MAETAGAGMDLNHDRSPEQAEQCGGILVVDLPYPVNLDKMVSGAERAELIHPPLPGPSGKRAGIRLLGAAVGFKTCQIFGLSVSEADHGRRALGKNAGKFAFAEAYAVPVTDTGRNRTVERIGKCLNPATDIFMRNAAPEQPDTAVDVVAYPAGRNHPLFGIEGGHSANGKPVPLVNVRHGERVALNSGKHRHMNQLLKRTVRKNLVEHRPGSVKPGGDQHTLHPVGGNFPQPVVYSPQGVS